MDRRKSGGPKPKTDTKLAFQITYLSFSDKLRVSVEKKKT
jgi:hypothetical protein